MKNPDFAPFLQKIKDTKPDAVFLFVDEEQLLAAAQREQAIPYDAPRLSQVKLNHRGERCSFEAIIEDYKLDKPGLSRLALIVRM